MASSHPPCHTLFNKWLFFILFYCSIFKVIWLYYQSYYFIPFYWTILTVWLFSRYIIVQLLPYYNNLSYYLKEFDYLVVLLYHFNIKWLICRTILLYCTFFFFFTILYYDYFLILIYCTIFNIIDFFFIIVLFEHTILILKWILLSRILSYIMVFILYFLVLVCFLNSWWTFKLIIEEVWE